RVPHDDDSVAVRLRSSANGFFEEEWLRFADADCLGPGRDLDRGDDRSRARQEPPLDGIGAVPVRADEFRTREDGALRLGDLRVREMEIEANDDGARCRG